MKASFLAGLCSCVCLTMGSLAVAAPVATTSEARASCEADPLAALNPTASTPASPGQEVGRPTSVPPPSGEQNDPVNCGVVSCSDQCTAAGYASGYCDQNVGCVCSDLF